MRLCSAITECGAQNPRQIEPRHAPAQTAVSVGLVQMVRILLSTHSQRQAACAELVSGNTLMQMASAIAARNRTVRDSKPDPSRVDRNVSLRLWFDLDPAR